ncbi:hypothetical protein JRO89_XS01G0025300 [Xanthoceras sorbifolium]|uniref:Uncharacterized protein n=1 Tax=Xanthoceras sorbifolium TaxID=99658 RepID=A0ABQ8IHZ2_9ROSI|nr:hypothetical protein JRO89_XS01G0025300 [Xanthoceras sorbifolium]
MATVAESSSDEEKPNVVPHGDIFSKSKALEEATPWIEYAVQQATLYQKIVQETIDSTIDASRSRLSEIGLTASAHFHQTIASLEGVKSEYAVYEDKLFGKVKEGIDVAASHPFITGGVAVGLGCLGLKRPRRFLYYNTLRLFVSEESPDGKDAIRLIGYIDLLANLVHPFSFITLLSRADTKVKELRQSIDRLKAESEKLERVASVAEDELIRGRTKLRQAGKQIQGVIRSAYKIERQAAGLKDILGELPRREASQFRSQVSNLASEAKRERNALSKEVSKISNFGISV